MTVDHSKHFTRKIPRGPRTICRYCKYEIEPLPCKGINERRGKHLDGCNEKPRKPDTIDISEKDYTDIIATTECVDHDMNWMMILPSM